MYRLCRDAQWLKKCTLVQALRLCTARTAHRGSRDISLPFHDLGTRRGEGLASRPGRILSPGKTRYPLYRRLGGPQGRSGQVRKIWPPPGFDPRTVQPVTSLYTDGAIPAHLLNDYIVVILNKEFWGLIFLYFSDVQLTVIEWRQNIPWRGLELLTLRHSVVSPKFWIVRNNAVSTSNFAKSFVEWITGFSNYVSTCTSPVSDLSDVTWGFAILTYPVTVCSCTTPLRCTHIYIYIYIWLQHNGFIYISCLSKDQSAKKKKYIS
jgi:hypothetical protein